MSEFKLISMTDFILQHKNLVNKSSIFDFATLVVNYAEFLKQPLKISMFVPCDEEGNPISKPKKQDYTEEDLACSVLGVDMVNYLEAKGKVLFEGFSVLFPDNLSRFVHLTNNDVKIRFDSDDETNATIEDFVIYNLTLTESAIKQIGL